MSLSTVSICGKYKKNVLSLHGTSGCLFKLSAISKGYLVKTRNACLFRCCHITNSKNIGLTFLSKLGLSFHIEIRGFSKTADFGFQKSRFLPKTVVLLETTVYLKTMVLSSLAENTCMVNAHLYITNHCDKMLANVEIEIDPWVEVGGW